ncbi:putative mitochondrial protein [Cucumis melo var. makuwa]|uniref:Mitochondrial protein n=1 Tax=Cucumis melo var. makuwa TaxID=1194695 RepID=A0A5A7VIM0_CUCMM|nr:putative mitochondrial protein [Cucumis melo var. makuwa]
MWENRRTIEFKRQPVGQHEREYVTTMEKLNTSNLSAINYIEEVNHLDKIQRELVVIKLQRNLCGELKEVLSAASLLRQFSLPTSMTGISIADLMGPMQVDSLGGKRYMLVIVDDYSRYIIKIGHENEFENQYYTNFCQSEGLFHEFSASMTPQQNGVVERKNWTLQEMESVMIHAKSLPIHFWAEVVNMACHIHNRIALCLGTTVTNYQLWKGRKPNIKYFHVFGSKCYILYDIEYHQKWDSKSDEEGSGNSSKTSTSDKSDKVQGSPDMNPIDMSDQTHDTHSPTSERCFPVDPSEAAINNVENAKLLAPSAHVKKNHPVSNVIGETDGGIMMRKKTIPDYAKMIVNELTPHLNNVNVIGTKCIFKDKTNEKGNVTRNKARLVAQSAFLNGFITEEVYVSQPKGFEDLVYPDYVYKLKKALYCLKQALVPDMTAYLLNKIQQHETGIFISQEKYARNLIKKYNLEDAKVKRTPAATQIKVSTDENGKKVDESLYRIIIGSLLYLTASHPDIAYVVGVCAHY